MSDSVWPHGLQPTRLLRPRDSPGKNTGVGCHFLLQCMKVETESEVTQSCLTLSNPMDCSLPGSSIHGIFQATVLECGAIAFSDNPIKNGQKTWIDVSTKMSILHIYWNSLEGWTLKFQYFGHLMQRANSLEKTLILGKTGGRGEVGAKDEMVGWHHRLKGHEFEQTQENGGQGSLACCSPWGHKEWDKA